MGISYACLQPLCLLLSIFHFFCFSLLSTSANIPTSNNETERLALLEIKSKISSDPLDIISSWNNSVHFCQWYGVTCGRRHQRVIDLDLSSLQLSGFLSPYVGNFSFLRKLQLDNNSFSYEIPPQIGHLRKLELLSLYNNSFTGQIPSSISNCSNLVFLYLDRNNLVGEIPAGIGSLLKLKDLVLARNSLTGTLPSSLGNLSSLDQLDVMRNNLGGVVPDTLGQLKNLWLLASSVNQFLGTFPPFIFNLSSIQVIDMSINQLQGNLSSDLFISLPNLQFFSIIDNQFTGFIPTSLSNASNLHVLQISENNLIGRVPSLDKLHKLFLFSCGFNYLGSGKADDLNFLVSTLNNATNLVTIGASNNNFGGKLPEQICNNTKNLQKIIISKNQIFGNIPTRISDCAALQILMAFDNKFSGIIPSSIGELQNLRYLFLDSNDFLGSVPSSIGNMTNLIRIDLSNNELQGIVPWMLGNNRNLLELKLSNNNLNGSIPPQLFELSPFSMGINLSRNHFTGFVPDTVENLKNIGILDISKNLLSGVIPKGLSSCESLEFLYMDGNLFQGSIPSSLSSLRALQELNLSHNMLFGKIPEFLKSFKSLQLLDLSSNNFEGMVPIEGVFKNATATSIAGNKNLCGGIPDFKLPSCKLHVQHKRGLTVKLAIKISIVFVIIGVVLMLIYLFLYFSKKRKAESTSTSFGNSFLNLSYQSLLKATNGFSLENLIGTGSFGSVYKGILDREGIVIAVKVLNLTRHGASKSFAAECEISRNIRHRNLVKVLTACSGVDYHGNDFKALVYDFMANGSLDGWLHPTIRLDEAPKTLNVLQRLNIAIDVACALEYLHHHCGTPVVHCDLKPSNILLDENMIGHVSDFGLVKFLSNETLDNFTNQFSSLGMRGTIGYCPPEYGMGREVSTSGDIFSFGILLMEMFTGKRPIDDMFKESMNLHNFVKRAFPDQVIQVIDPSLLQVQLNMRNNRLVDCLISIFEIGISCSVESPQDRMSIGDVVARLSSIKNKLVERKAPGV